MQPRLQKICQISMCWMLCIWSNYCVYVNHKKLCILSLDYSRSDRRKLRLNSRLIFSNFLCEWRQTEITDCPCTPCRQDVNSLKEQAVTVHFSKCCSLGVRMGLCMVHPQCTSGALGSRLAHRTSGAGRCLSPSKCAYIIVVFHTLLHTVVICLESRPAQDK